MPDKIRNINIRATTLPEFWGDEYPDSVYLWQGSKHDRSLAEIMDNDVPTLKDRFATQEEMRKGHEFCLSFYYTILPILARKLNFIHGTKLSVCFWQTAFGYWLYRHIAITYDKYVYLDNLDIDATGIKLLAGNDFYIPDNHQDYIFCFTGDFGVQQLVSHYYYLFKNKDFPCEGKQFNFKGVTPNRDIDAMAIRLREHYRESGSEPKIALLGVTFPQHITDLLFQKSDGLINTFYLPPTVISSRETDLAGREQLARCAAEKSFDFYFIQTLFYCLPKAFMEHFRSYYDLYREDIYSRKFSHIVSEHWITDIQCSIYIATAKENDRKFIAIEHGSGFFFIDNGTSFMEYDVSDFYITVGWKKEISHLVQGGFACRDIVPYIFNPDKKKILFISRTKFIYWAEFNENNAVNSTFIRELKTVSDFVELLPDRLRADFVFRPRKVDYLWDTERTLVLERNNVAIDRGDFTESLSQAKIVVIDHITTGIAEILLMKAPFLLLYDVDKIPLSDELKQFFPELISCGVVHTSAESAVSQLSSIYENVAGWWQSESVQGPVNKLIGISLAPASKTTDCLLSLLKESLHESETDHEGGGSFPGNNESEMYFHSNL